MSAVIDIATVIATTLEWLIGLGLAILVPIIGAWVLVRRKDTKGWSRTQWFLALMWHWVFLTVPWWFLWGAIVATAFRIDDPSRFRSIDGRPLCPATRPRGLGHWTCLSGQGDNLFVQAKADLIGFCSGPRGVGFERHKSTTTIRLRRVLQ